MSPGSFPNQENLFPNNQTKIPATINKIPIDNSTLARAGICILLTCIFKLYIIDPTFNQKYNHNI
jgi:hypothetical protein